MKRFWVSWWTANHINCGVDKWPESLVIWVTGQRKGGLFDLQESLCAVIDTDESEAEIWAALRSWFPDLEKRFYSLKPSGFQPGDRFPGFDPARVTIERKPSPGMTMMMTKCGEVSNGEDTATIAK